MKNHQQELSNNTFLFRLSVVLPVLTAVFSALFFFRFEFNLITLYKYLKFTGRCALMTFMLSFGASTVYHFFPGILSGWVLRYRRYWGISYGTFMIMHILGLLTKFIYDPPFFINDTTFSEIIFGFIALVFTVAMLVTSNDQAQKQFGKNWKRLHTVGGNTLLLVFWLTYLDHDLVHLPIFMLINSLIVLRSVRRMQIIRNTKKIILWKLICVLIATLSTGLISYYFLKEKYQFAEFTGVEFKSKDYFPLYEGNRWTYRIEDSNGETFIRTYEIRGTETVNGQKTVKIYFSEDGYKCYAYDETGIRKYKEYDEGRSEIYDPPCSILPDMMFNVVKKFETKYTEPFDQTKKDAHVTGEIEFKITGVEEVVVKAGRFSDCLRVEYYDKWVEPDGSFDSTTGVFWVAEQTGVVKEIAQLKKYDPQNNLVSRYQETAELMDVVIRQ